MTANNIKFHMHLLLFNLHCSKCCACHGDCQHILETAVDNDSDNNFDWLCSCNLQWNFDLIVCEDIAGECVHFQFHFICSVYNLSYSVTCGEPPINIHMSIRKKIWYNYVLYTLNRLNYMYKQIRVICISLVHGAQVRNIEQFTIFITVRNTWCIWRVDVNEQWLFFNNFKQMYGIDDIISVM